MSGTRLWAATIAIALSLSCDAPRDPWNVLVICLDTVRFDTFWLTDRAGVPDAFSPWIGRGSPPPSPMDRPRASSFATDGSSSVAPSPTNGTPVLNDDERRALRDLGDLDGSPVGTP